MRGKALRQIQAEGFYYSSVFGVSKTLPIFAMPNSSNTTAKYIDYYATIRRTPARLFFGIAAVWRQMGYALFVHTNQIVFRKCQTAKQSVSR